MLDKRLVSMRYQLVDMAEREAMKLWRLARNAEKRDISKEVIHEIREEANILYNTMTAYPERLLAWDFRYKYKYAFKY